MRFGKANGKRVCRAQVGAVGGIRGIYDLESRSLHLVMDVKLREHDSGALVGAYGNIRRM